MKIYMKTKTGRYNAVAEYDPNTQQTVVLSGSLVSPTIAAMEHFRSANAIKRLREGTVVDRIMVSDMTFKSLSHAACFVGSNSHNGLDDWKTEDGESVRSFLQSLSAFLTRGDLHLPLGQGKSRFQLNDGFRGDHGALRV